jgi:hypothetical protein
MEGEGKGPFTGWLMEGEGEGPFARWSMEGEGEGPFARWSMEGEGEGEGSLLLIPIPPQANLLKPSLLSFDIKVLPCHGLRPFLTHSLPFLGV